MMLDNQIELAEVNASLHSCKEQLFRLTCRAILARILCNELKMIFGELNYDMCASYLKQHSNSVNRFHDQNLS